MNYRKIYTGCLLSICMATTSHAAIGIQNSGQDKSVEWQQKGQWSTSGRVLDMVHSLDGKNIFLLNDNAQVQVFSNGGDLLGSIPVDKGVSAIDIAPQGETLYLIDNYNNSFTSLSVSFIQKIDVSGSPFEGPADAPVTIALFTDFE